MNSLLPRLSQPSLAVYKWFLLHRNLSEVELMLENVFLQYFSDIRLKIDKFNLLMSTVGLILLLVSFLAEIVINCNLKGIFIQ